MPPSSICCTPHPCGMSAASSMTLYTSDEGTFTSGTSFVLERSRPARSSLSVPESDSVTVRNPVPVGLNTAPGFIVSICVVPLPVMEPVTAST